MSTIELTSEDHKNLEKVFGKDFRTKYQAVRIGDPEGNSRNNLMLRTLAKNMEGLNDAQIAALGTFIQGFLSGNPVAAGVLSSSNVDYAILPKIAGQTRADVLSQAKLAEPVFGYVISNATRKAAELKQEAPRESSDPAPRSHTPRPGG